MNVQIPGEQVEERGPEECRPPEFSDESLALKFAEQNKDHLRFVDKWGRWMIYDGKRWAEDDTLRAYDLARRVCRQSAAICSKQNVAKTIASAKTVAAVVTLARADRRLAATAEQWDSDPWLLNTQSGVVDLRTREERAHQPSDYITKISGVAPESTCPIPIWLAFLDRVMDGDSALVSFLQRVIGYGLTGITREHALFFLYGTGANGKTTFINTVIGCAGDYHRPAPIDTFTGTKFERHPTDLAGLRGVRTVTAVETEEGKGWAESKVKQLTGGEKISARFMRQDFFDFIPEFKLIIAGNHKPSLRTVDEAIRRRFNLVPFMVTIPQDERDDTLTERLRAEWPGILAWMIDGCGDWQEGGLRPPQAVLDATAAYLEAEDSLRAWIDEACFREPDAWEKSSALFGAWKRWAEQAGEEVGTQKAFSQKLEARGFTLTHRNTGNGFSGLRLIPQMTADER